MSQLMKEEDMVNWSCDWLGMTAGVWMTS